MDYQQAKAEKRNSSLAVRKIRQSIDAIEAESGNLDHMTFQDREISKRKMFDELTGLREELKEAQNKQAEAENQFNEIRCQTVKNVADQVNSIMEAINNHLSEIRKLDHELIELQKEYDGIILIKRFPRLIVFHYDDRNAFKQELLDAIEKEFNGLIELNKQNLKRQETEDFFEIRV